MPNLIPFQFVLAKYGIPAEEAEITPVSSGLIHRTWKVGQGGRQFILQQVNHQVFKDPEGLAHNVSVIGQYLKTHNPAYFFVSQLSDVDGRAVVQDQEGMYFRLFPYVEGSRTFSTAPTPEHAFEAAFQFGRFARLLSGFDPSHLHIGIPNFHNLAARYRHWQDILRHGNKERIKQSRAWIAKCRDHQDIVDTYNHLVKDPQVIQRVTHHDTKISNVLFDADGKGICVIDLDTVMPGYFISDVGDMMRTYLSPAGEEERELDGVVVREEYFKAIIQGYLDNMGDKLTPVEQGLLFYAGRFMLFMQGLRFLTDYCQDDTYYGAAYPEQNFYRAHNQFCLLEKLEEKKSVLMPIIAAALKSYYPLS